MRAGWLLSLDRQVGNHRNGGVLIEDGRIVEVGPDVRPRGAELIDVPDGILIPGFVDSHRHVWEAAHRHVLTGSLDSAPQPPSDPEQVYRATLVGLLGSLEAGVTTVVDHVDLPPEYLEAVTQAHRDGGVRTVLATEPDTPTPDLPPDTTAAAALPGSADAASAWQAARRRGARIHTHLGSDPSHRGQAAALARAGLLGPDVTVAHPVHLDSTDFAAIGSAGGSVAVAAQAEMAAGLGNPPMQEMIDHGVGIGLAVGSERFAPPDLFAAMRAAISVQHAVHFDLKLAGKGGLPSLMTTRDVIRYATVGGAVAAGLGETCGSITPGKAADLVVLRTDLPNIHPINDPIGAVVWGMDTFNVGWVLVGGRRMVEDGGLVSPVAVPVSEGSR